MNKEGALDGGRPLYENPVIYRRRWFLFAILCLSLVIVVMSVAGLNVALPDMQRQLHLAASQLQWIVDSYALVFAALLLPAGALGDRFGRKKALLFGLVLFAGGSLVGGLAETSEQIITGRVITGVGAAFVMPSTLSLLVTIFPPQERRRAIAIWTGSAGAGGIAGPLVSGALLDSYWWGSAMLVNVPIVVGVLVAVLVFAPECREASTKPLDPAGAALSLVGLGALIFGIIEGPAKGWTDPTILAALAVAAVMLIGFVRWERRATDPMLPLTLFEDRRLSVGSGVITVSFLLLYGLGFLFTLYLQFARDYSPFTAGLSMVPVAVTLLAVAPRSATLADRFGTGPVIAAGFILISAGFGMLALVGPRTPFLVLGVSMALLGAGVSLAAAPATGSIMSAVPDTKTGVGSALNDTTREVGGALGIAVLGSVAGALYRSALDLEGLSLPPPVARAAHESVGAATVIAERLQEGKELAARAGDAFTQAFNLTSAAAAAIALVAAFVVLAVFNRRAEQLAASKHEPSHPLP